MKKQILEALKAKFQDVSESILSRMAEIYAKTVTTEAEVATTVEGVTLAKLLEGYGDSRATEAQRTAVQTYEKKHGLKDGQKADGGEPAKKPEPDAQDANPDVPAWAKALLDSNKALAEKLSNIEGEKVTTTRKQKLDAIIQKLPENLRKPYSRLPVKDYTDEEFETLTTEITTEVETIAKETTAKGAVFGRPVTVGTQAADTGKKASKEEVDAVVNSLNV